MPYFQRAVGTFPSCAAWSAANAAKSNGELTEDNFRSQFYVDFPTLAKYIDKLVA